MFTILKLIYRLISLIFELQFLLIFNKSWNMNLLLLLLRDKTLTMTRPTGIFHQVTKSFTSITFLLFVKEWVLSNTSSLTRVAGRAFNSIIFSAAITLWAYYLFVESYRFWEFWIEESWLKVKNYFSFYICAIEVHALCFVWLLMLFTASLLLLLSSLLPHVEEFLIGIVIVIHESLLAPFPFAPFNLLWINMLLFMGPTTANRGQVVVILLLSIWVDQSFVSQC